MKLDMLCTQYVCTNKNLRSDCSFTVRCVRFNPTMPVTKKKQTRTSLSLQKKIEILDKLDLGQGPGNIAKEYDINPSTISKLKKQGDSNAFASSNAMAHTYANVVFAPLMSLAETLLLVRRKATARQLFAFSVARSSIVV